MLKRIAEDRRSQQQKMNAGGGAAETSLPAVKEQKLGGRIQTNVDNNCLLMVTPPSLTMHRWSL